MDRRSPPNEAAPPWPCRPDIEPHLLFERLQIKFHEIGKTALQHKIRHTTGELRGLVRVATKADGDFASAPVDANPLLGVGEHISQLVAEPPVADPKIIREAERSRPRRHFVQRFTQNATENLRRTLKEIRKLRRLGVDLGAHRT